MNAQFWTLFATFFGIGKLKFLPGTAASLAALLFLLNRSTPQTQLVLILAVYFLGVKASNFVITKTGKMDPSEVVIDEVCGILVTFFLVPVSWVTAVSGFILFRFFDIVKPFPIRQLEKLPKGWGVMTDDLAAGVASNIILQLASHFLLK